MAAVAAVLVVTAAAVYLVGIRPGSGADAGAAAVAAIPTSRTVLLLEQRREELIAMSSAYGTLSLVGTPKLASRQSLTPLSTGGGTGGVPAGPPPSPGSAQSIAYNMMASFGFNPRVYFGCLNNIWSRESGWVYNAMNPSGAYGIPQALPGSKMASAGSDWQTNPATQIRWGLGYIKSTYGDPCSAWAFWQAHGYY
ncbi:MAG TPA: lytic transglycosylase domain-containing protein [Streptosporangiaceae bacterium]|nr:lytic transglycosylase domain-containing protein [Streptosporangiaceae bacterium]